MVKISKCAVIEDNKMRVVKIKKTSMNGFGGTSRINHDSSKFYNRKLFHLKEQENQQVEQENKLGKYLDSVIYKNSENLKCIPSQGSMRSTSGKHEEDLREA